MKKGLMPHLMLFLALIGISGCAKLLGDLRRDLDDSKHSPEEVDDPVADSGPTSGGTWAEREYMGRSPSAEKPRQEGRDAGRANGWISQDQVDANRRDSQRRGAEEFVDRPEISSGSVPNLEPEKKREYKRGSRATKDDFVDQSQEEGSLWASSGQTNYYFTKNRVRSPGDLITLVLEQDLYKDIGVETKRTLNMKEQFDEVALVQNQFRKKFFADLDKNKDDNLATSAASPERAPAAAPETSSAPSQPQANLPADPKVNDGVKTSGSPTAKQGVPMTPEQLERAVPKASIADVDIYPSLQMKAGDTMMGEIVDRYPNGNYKIRTVKRIIYKNGPPRIVSVVGIVKESDITEEGDVVKSGKLYEYRVEVSR
jgi:flagellar basal body L-ring protein FlgH